MYLHENKKLFTDAVLATSEYLDIRPVYIEKDYWITRSLKLMTQNSNADKAIFKGGTSLSKAHKIGNRFSEDIDIAISDADVFTGNQLKMLIKRALELQQSEGVYFTCDAVHKHTTPPLPKLHKKITIPFPRTPPIPKNSGQHLLVTGPS